MSASEDLFASKSATGKATGPMPPERIERLLQLDWETHMLALMRRAKHAQTAMTLKEYLRRIRTREA